MVTPLLSSQGLAPEEYDELRKAFRALAKPLSAEQVLDLADLLHELIRERRIEERSWERTHHRLIY